MTKSMLTCPLCGFQFDPSDHPSCRSCPLDKACQMVCCPACNHTTIDPSRSKLAQVISRLLAQENSSENVLPQE